MTLAEKIKAAEAVITNAKNAISALLKTSEDENRELDEAEQAQVDEHSDAIDAATKSLNSLRRAEAALAMTARGNAPNADGQSAAPSRPGAPAQARGRGNEADAVFVRAATAHFLAHVRKQPLEVITRDIYGDDARMEAITKAATGNATTTQVGWAAELVHTSFQAMLDELKPDFIYARLASLGVALDFGTNGSISLPRRNPGGLNGSFVQENATIPVKQGSLGTIVLNRYKMGVISTFTQELARTSVPSIEAIIRDGIRTDTATAIDAALFDGAAAVAGVRPASILNGVVGTPSSGNTTDDVLKDMGVLLKYFAAQNAGRKLVTIMNPSHAIGLSMLVTANGVFMFKAELDNNRFMGTTVLQSTTVPIGKIIMVDAADFATGLGIPEFDVSDTATLVMANDNGVAPTMSPTGAITVGGSIPVSGAAGTTPPTAVQSLFQTWAVGVRMVMPLSWGMRRSGMVDQITGVNW